MYLKSVTVKGFKSFPDRTTAGVRPGRQRDRRTQRLGQVQRHRRGPVGARRAVTGRGPRSDDAGRDLRRRARTQGRPRAAEVELVLDDSEQSLGLGVSEISIVRRLDRSGEGEYRLAGARCRLIDVIELMSDTGLGKEMHSVISQGRVESLVTSKPRERRLLIEEAAGLGKHRKRRRRAQLKLERTARQPRSGARRRARGALAAAPAQASGRGRRAARAPRAPDARDPLGAGARRAARPRSRLRRGRRRAPSGCAPAAHRACRRAADGRRSPPAGRGGARGAQRPARGALAPRACGAGRGRADRLPDRVRRGDPASGSRSGWSRPAPRSRRCAPSPTADREDPEAAARIESLEAELEALQRDRDAELARQLSALETELAATAPQIDAREQTVAAALAAAPRAAIVAPSAPAVRSARRSAPPSVHVATPPGSAASWRRSTSFCAIMPAAIDGATALADSLDVAPGYELAVAAALDGRLSAAVVDVRSRRRGAAGPRRRRWRSSARAPSAGLPAPPPRRPHRRPGPSHCLTHVRGDESTLTIVSRLLADTWVVDDPADCAPTFTGVAVTRGGRVWSARTRELRQAPAVGEERVLAQRNRREQLLGESERAAGAELEARRAVELAPRPPRPTPTVAARRSSRRTAPRSRPTMRRSRRAVACRRRSTVAAPRPTRAPAPTGAPS